MAPGMSYDDSGSLANYFGVTFLALILVPVTYFSFKPDRKGESPPSRQS
jgi:translocation protein SEC63